MNEILEKVNSPNELKQLTKSELVAYCNQARDFIVEKVTKTGGHLSSNLGAVELSVALHYVFNSPLDKIVFDVGHQSYTHKLITGRRDLFDMLRHDGGMSGFPNADESEHDHFTTGHSSNSLSLGLGLARGRDLMGENYNVISVIGDGAFTGGQAYEALCDIGAHKDKMLIVLNDNEMSISKNVGAFSEHLAKLRLSKKYSSLKFSVKRAVSGLPFFGDKLVKLLERTKNSVKSSLIVNKIFENLGVKYYGPINGHDLGAMIDMLDKLKDFNGPALLHIVTEKGKGVDYVSQEPSKFHGVSPQGEKRDISYASVVRNKMIELAKVDKKVVAVTAAMANGTGLDYFAQTYPNRYFDVGIAEQHAVSMCAGLAKSGLKPYFTVYSSFLQRAFDQVIEDTGI
ncbi:MAG: 1-deoxy-D-xylulose-5-phosphate synthase, partial [Clostridia bacterium]|nr:1-deoxy-D-xylulose-5-phosphate synthase [Clostridia bacterium]